LEYRWWRAPGTGFILPDDSGSPTIGERWIIEEAAGHRWPETWAGALQAEVAKGMLLTSRKIYMEFWFHYA
jgi:hypothetical protein